MSRSKKSKSTSELLVSIGKFDTRKPLVRPIFENVPIQGARSINHDDYSPAGGTPLNDAVLQFVGQLDQNYKSNPNALHVGLLADESGSMGHLRDDVIEGFNTFIEEVRADESKGGEPGVILVVMTDGLENSSHEDPYGEQVREITKQKEAEGWNFFYLGANQDTWATGASYGLGAQSVTLDYAHTSGGTRMAMGSTASLINTRKAEGTTSENFAALASEAVPDVKNYLEDEKDEDKIKEKVS